MNSDRLEVLAARVNAAPPAVLSPSPQPSPAPAAAHISPSEVDMDVDMDVTGAFPSSRGATALTVAEATSVTLTLRVSGHLH